MSIKKYLESPVDQADRIIKVRGSWIIATVDPRMSWPTKKQVTTYENMDFVLFPQSENESAGVALRADQYGLDSITARKTIMRFCSALSWSKGAGLEIIAWLGAHFPRPVHVRRGYSATNYLETDYLPSVESNEEQAALALYREGISLGNPFYAFLSLYKVISVVLPKGRARAKWIDETLDGLDDHRAKERCSQLVGDGVDVGQYIWDEGRNAIAHAERKPYINPDEVDDHSRLQMDMPLLKNLAELAIEQKTGISRPRTIWRNHHYELQGFREIIPGMLLEFLEKSEPVPEGSTIELPEQFTVLARRGSEIYAFENLQPEIIDQVEGGMMLDFVSDDEVFRFRTLLNFSEERLHFDPINGIGFTADRKDKQKISGEISVLKFQRTILSNGHLEIWDSEFDTMLGRSEECVPVNCFVDLDFYKSELAKLNDLLAE